MTKGICRFNHYRTMNSFLKRTLSGTVFAVIMITSTLWDAKSYMAVTAFIIAVMNYEYLRITAGKGLMREKAFAVLTSVSLFVNSAAGHMLGLGSSLMILSVIPAALIFISMLYRRNPEDYSRLAHIIASVVYTGMPFTILNAGIFDDAGTYNGKLLLSMYIILWGSDVGAYLFGITLGQKFGAKLFPSVSPNKSWIGFFGGLSAAIAAAAILQNCGMLAMDALEAVLLGIIINVSGVFGDLVESQLKRNFAVKDSGTIMPGHGGLLDRFDGALIGFPAATVYLISILN